MKRRHFASICAVIVTSASLLWAPGSFAAIATIEVGQDNSVGQEFPTRSAGLCDSLYAGNTDNYDPGNNVLTARRALLQFDLSSIPAGSIINSVTLNMTVTRGGNHLDSNFDLYPITLPWVEGTNSDCSFKGGGQLDPGTADGVTWNTQPTFGATPSASLLMTTTTPSWSSAQMVTDVQEWLDGDRDNYGWILIGDETTPTLARRFGALTKQDNNGNPVTGDNPPQLVVDFALDPDADAEACCEANGDCSLTLVGSGTCGGDPQGVDTTCDPNLCPQPTGACCTTENICTDTDPLTCEGDGGTFVGGNCNQADCGLTPFVEALPIPPILQSDGTNAQGHATYTVSVEEATQSVHPDLPDTTVWTYNGAWPSSTFVATSGEPIEVTYENNLPDKGNARGSSIVEVDTCAHGPNDWGNAKRISTHLHGGHLPARFDGQPEFTILPGETDVYQYPNNQDAGTVWYHDHALGITRLNVYGGMAGFYLIRDDEDTLGLGDQTNALNLPNAAEGNEIGLAVQDRTFNEDGSLFYNAQLEDAFKGEYAVVNGKVNPYLEVRQGKYRFRLLNGSQSREYIYRLETVSPPSEVGNDPDFVLIGTDLGLVETPRNFGNTTGTVVGPAERLDVVIDFAGYPVGTEIILKNDDMTQPLLPNIMKFIVSDQLGPGHTDDLPSTLRTFTPLLEGSQDVTRYFRLAKSDPVPCKDGSMRMINEWLIESLDGPDGTVTGKHWDDVTEYPLLGQREVWEFFNDTNSYHPMHVHLVKFQILSKTGPSGSIPLQPWEANAWKDIVHIPPNSTARIIMDFEDYPGRFPSHCHLLDHEDHEMMRQFQTVGGVCNNNGTCDPGENCSAPPFDSGCADCPQLSGALCGNGLCEAGDGENCDNCAADCAGRQKGSQQNQFCCGFDDGQVTNSVECDQGAANAENRCIDPSAGLACRVTPRLPACCGDFMCEGQETVSNCAVDCDPIDCTLSEPGTEVTCNDGEDNDCDELVDGADPDCQGACVPDEAPEQSCFDGNDNDCDEQIDCADLDNCDGVADPTRPTSCGVGVCATTGNIACSGGSEADNCTPLPATEPGAEVTCDDGLDNDCDGLSDANDSDCQVCVPDEDPETTLCFDGNDNDCDGQTDCSDSSCDGTIDPARPTTCGVGACASTGNIACSGGGETDTCTPGTPGNEGPDGDPTCSDGIDNDCDGDTDANDADCQGAVVCGDITSKNACNNEPTCEWQGSPQNGTCVPIGGGVCNDGDGDGYGDPGDPSCPNGAQTDCDDTNASVSPGEIEGPEGDPTCSDGLDNNCNGDTDLADPACQPPAACDTINDKPTCNNTEGCRWSGSPQNGSCGPA